jgi:hypothetical protein
MNGSNTLIGDRKLSLLREANGMEDIKFFSAAIQTLSWEFTDFDPLSTGCRIGGTNTLDGKAQQRRVSPGRKAQKSSLRTIDGVTF